MTEREGERGLGADVWVLPVVGGKGEVVHDGSRRTVGMQIGKENALEPAERRSGSSSSLAMCPRQPTVQKNEEGAKFPGFGTSGSGDLQESVCSRTVSMEANRGRGRAQREPFKQQPGK